MSPPPAGLDYPRWIAESLRLVVRRALEEVDAHGLPAEHHFLITVRTDAPGVGLPGFLRKQYPEEITLVLENQFWDLVVDDEGFSVTLAFTGSRQRLFTPWEAVTAFADPPARLALRFAPPGTDALAEPGDDHGGPAAESSPWGVPAGEGPGEEEEEAESGGEGGASGEVVRIDRFRRRREDDEDD